MRATAIIPVKRFGFAKQRLLEALDRPRRAALVKAMLSDVLAATADAELVERVIVVTGEGRAERIALRHAQRAATPLEVLRDPQDTRPPGGGDPGDHPGQGARGRVRRPASRRLPAARPGRARRGARADAERSRDGRARPPRHRNERAAALAAGRDRPGLRPGQLRPSCRPRTPARSRARRRAARLAGPRRRHAGRPRRDGRGAGARAGPRPGDGGRAGARRAARGSGPRHERPASRSCRCAACPRSQPASASAS